MNILNEKKKLFPALSKGKEKIQLNAILFPRTQFLLGVVKIPSHATDYT
jgi:hypothetical protein